MSEIISFHNMLSVEYSLLLLHPSENTSNKISITVKFIQVELFKTEKITVRKI